MKAIDKLPTRQYAHPFDRPVRIEGDQETHGVDHSSDAIGGCYGIGWREAFRCHKSGQVYAVHCSDGVRRGKAAHSDRDLRWIGEMRQRIIARTTTQRNGPIVLSSREWAIMLHFDFYGWLDELPRKDEDGPHRTVGDKNRHLDSGEVGTINGMAVIVDPKASDNLPPVGNFGGEEPRLAGRTRTATPRHEPTRFGGVFEAAFARAASRAS